MVTLRRPPQAVKRGPRLEPYQVILRPLITEKATHQANPTNRYGEGEEERTRVPSYTFEVNPLATKTDIKNAIEVLFNVKVVDVRTQNRRGKARRYRLKVGHTRGWKKAVVTLSAEHRIDFF